VDEKMEKQASVIYEVNLKIDNSIIEDYKAWLEKHCRDIISLEGFLFVEWF
jgi:hypothetical protein